MGSSSPTWDAIFNHQVLHATWLRRREIWLGPGIVSSHPLVRPSIYFTFASKPIN